MLGPNRNTGSDSIEELKKRLYTRGDMGRRVLRDSRLRAREENTPESWVKEKESDTELMSRKPKTGIFKKLFIASLLFFVAAISYASYQFLGGNNVVSSKNPKTKFLIEILFKIPNFALPLEP